MESNETIQPLATTENDGSLRALASDVARAIAADPEMRYAGRVAYADPLTEPQEYLFQLTHAGLLKPRFYSDARNGTQTEFLPGPKLGTLLDKTRPPAAQPATEPTFQGVSVSKLREFGAAISSRSQSTLDAAAAAMGKRTHEAAAIYQAFDRSLAPAAK